MGTVSRGGRLKEGLNSKVKLSLYNKVVEFKQYLHGVSDTASRLMFKFRPGTHGLNEELGRHRGREGMKECLLCDDECESVSHVLWECPANSSLRDNFLVALQGMLGDEFEHFQSLGSFEKVSFVLGSELWKNKCGSIHVKSYILDAWELKERLDYYGDNPSVQ